MAMITIYIFTYITDILLYIYTHLRAVTHSHTDNFFLKSYRLYIILQDIFIIFILYIYYFHLSIIIFINILGIRTIKRLYIGLF